jgi:integrase
VRRWNTAVSNAYVQALDRETIPEGQGSARKESGSLRFAARSKNRKIDHLRTFARWLSEQVPCPVPSGYPMRDISRFEVPVLEAKRFDPRELLRMEAAVADLGVTEVRRDKRRSDLQDREVRKDARPLRDQAIFALLIGSGLRIQAVANLNADQLDFVGQTKRLWKVREKGKVERDVIITKGAANAIALYIDGERQIDSEAWNGARALFLSVPFQARKRDDTRKGRMSTRTLSYVVAKIADHAQVDGVHPHRFRHHVGYLMNELGGITAVQKQLGHRNIAYSA